VKLVAWDIETLKGFFCIVIYEYDTRQKIIFEISPRKNQLESLKKYIKNVTDVVSFNGVHFDDFILHWLINQTDVNEEDIYDVAQAIITGDKDGYLYQSIKSYKWKIPWRQVDLFLFWSKGLRISKKLSLKSLANSLGMSIIEMPIHFTRDNLTEVEMQMIVDYCINDIDVTVELSKNSKVRDSYGAYTRDLMKLRYSIEKEFRIPGATCMDAPKIASEYLMNQYTTDYNVKKELKRSRFELPIFQNKDYLPIVNFKTDFFKNIYKEIQESYNGYKKEVLFKNPTGEYLKLSYGSGGLHSVNKEEKYLEDDIFCYITSDVALI
jgi:hypothetical protein